LSLLPFIPSSTPFSLFPSVSPCVISLPYIMNVLEIETFFH
jgi:hypothetical protein